MMLTLLFISPRSIGNSFFKFASLTAAILLGMTLGFNFLFPSPVRTNQLPVIFLVISAILIVIYNRVVDIDKFTAAYALLVGGVVTGLISVATDSMGVKSIESFARAAGVAASRSRRTVKLRSICHLIQKVSSAAYHPPIGAGGSRGR